MDSMENGSLVAKLQTILYQNMIAGDQSSIEALASAATTDGFFYLEFPENDEFAIYKNMLLVRSLSEKFFDSDQAEKIEYSTRKLSDLLNYGYKPPGQYAGVTERKQDGYELFSIPSDVLMQSNGTQKPLTLPSVLRKETALLQHFTVECAQVCTVVLKYLSYILGLQGSTLEMKHRPDHSSESTLTLLKYSRKDALADLAGHIAHTDVGSLTLLFCREDGLQIFQQSDNAWANVEPRHNSAVVNIGDSLRLLSGEKFSSCLHRVLPFTSQKEEARYSIAYFLRPENDSPLLERNGKVLTGINWYRRKFDAFSGEETSNMAAVLEGKCYATEDN